MNALVPAMAGDTLSQLMTRVRNRLTYEGWGVSLVDSTTLRVTLLPGGARVVACQLSYRNADQIIPGASGAGSLPLGDILHWRMSVSPP